jgi:hypothetical protein
MCVDVQALVDHLADRQLLSCRAQQVVPRRLERGQRRKIPDRVLEQRRRLFVPTIVAVNGLEESQQRARRQVPKRIGHGDGAVERGRLRRVLEIAHFGHGLHQAKRRLDARALVHQQRGCGRGPHVGAAGFVGGHGHEAVEHVRTHVVQLAGARRHDGVIGVADEHGAGQGDRGFAVFHERAPRVEQCLADASVRDAVVESDGKSQCRAVGYRRRVGNDGGRAELGT